MNNNFTETKALDNLNDATDCRYTKEPRIMFKMIPNKIIIVRISKKKKKTTL